MSSIKKILTSGVAALAISATLFTGAAPAQAHDGRNAALVGGLVVGALIGGALASADQSAYQSYDRIDDDGYVYQAPRRYESGNSTYRSYDDSYSAPRYRDRDCDDDYRTGWNSDD